MMKSILVLVVLLAFVACGMASASWFDNFESYASTAELSPTYTQMFAVPMQLDTSKGYLSSKSLYSGVNNNSEARMYRDLPGGAIAGTDANPIKFEFMVDITQVGWHTREYIELRSYAGGAYNTGALQDLIAMGFMSSGVDTTKANYRILSGPAAGWADFTSPSATRTAMAAANWTKLTALIKTNQIEFYVNDVFDHSKARNPNWQYDSIVIGSGLSTAIPVWFDNLNVEVVPEPGSLLALGTGLVGVAGLIRRRRA